MGTQLSSETSGRRASRRGRAGPIVALLAALGLLLGACGNGGDDGDDAAPASIDNGDNGDNGDGDNGDGEGGGSTDPEDAALEYAQCMRDHGVDMPDPEVQEGGEFGIDLTHPEGMSEEEFAAAQAACDPILEEARPEREPPSPEELAETRDRAVALAECMRDRGHDYPDPVINEDGGMEMPTPPGAAPGDPGFEEFEQDLEDCQEEAGMESPGEGGGSTSESGGEGSGGEA
jgi:hypothetical protein